MQKVVGVAMVVLVSIWTGHFMGGFAGSSDASLEFNWHPLLLVISLVFLYGNGILVYRVARWCHLEDINQILIVQAWEKESAEGGSCCWWVSIITPVHERLKNAKFYFYIKCFWWSFLLIVMGSATLLAFFGLKAVFNFHAEKEIPHTYSLHSW